MTTDRKSPAFSFYATDFLVGTLRLTLAQRGAYITLLAYQWDHGSIPDDAIERARLLNCAPQQAARLWAGLQEKFRQGTDGAWRNGRLEAERVRQMMRRAALARNGAKGGRPRKPNAKQTETKRLSHSRHADHDPDNQMKSLPSSSSSSSLDLKSTGAARQPVENSKRETEDLTPATFAFACVVMREALACSETLDHDASLGNVAEHFKRICAGHRVAYDRDVVRKAYDAVTVADQRRA